MDFEIECPYCGEWVTIFALRLRGASRPYAQGDRPLSDNAPHSLPRARSAAGPWTVHAVEEEPGGFAVGLARQDE